MNLWCQKTFQNFLQRITIFGKYGDQLVSTVVAGFNRYCSGSNPAKLGKSIEMHPEMEFWDSQRSANSPRTCPEALEHVPACFRRVSGRYTAENLPKLIKIYEIHPKSDQIPPNPPNPSKIKVSEKNSRFFQFLDRKNIFRPAQPPPLVSNAKVISYNQFYQEKTWFGGR